MFTANYLSVVGYLTSQNAIKFGNTSDLYYNQLRNWERKEMKRKPEVDQNWKGRWIHTKYPADVNVRI